MWLRTAREPIRPLTPNYGPPDDCETGECADDREQQHQHEEKYRALWREALDARRRRGSLSHQNEAEQLHSENASDLTFPVAFVMPADMALAIGAGAIAHGLIEQPLKKKIRTPTGRRQPA